MNLISILILTFFVFNIEIYADCFIYKQKDKITKTGECSQRVPPQSSFKLAISLMGFDAGILIDELNPQIPFEEGFPDSLKEWKAPQTPTSWIKFSCVWYSQFVVKKLGADKFQEYMKKFEYGNQDISGDKGKENSLTSSWISSSIKISPEEQLAFVEKILSGSLPVKSEAILMTKKILYLEDLPNGWKLYGKTGTGDVIKSDGSHDTDHERGWFVGWIAKESETIPFVQYIEIENKKSANSFNYIAGKKAKELAKEELRKL